MWSIIGGVVQSAISPIANIFQTKQERKKLVEQAEAKLKHTKVANEHEVTLTDAEAESIMAQQSGDTWKDEYVTIVVTAPILGILAGAVMHAFGYGPELLDGTLKGVAELKSLGLDWGFLTEAVVISAIGLKVWRKV